MTTTQAKLDRAHNIRDRLMDNLKHHFIAIRAFDATTSKTAIAMRERTLDKVWQEFLLNWDTFDTLSNGKADDKIQKENCQIEDQYFDIKGLLADLTPVKDASLDDTVYSVVNETKFLNIRLPPINIKPFSGKSEDWVTFRDMFQSLISSNIDMPGVQKLHYLKAYLEPKALQTIKHLAINNENFDGAWALLEERFHDKRAIITSHLRNFFGIKPLVSDQSQTIREMIDNTNEFLSNMHICSIDATTWDPIIIHSLTQRFDSDTLRHWEENLNGTKTFPKLSQLMKFLEIRNQILQNTQQLHPIVSNSSKVERSDQSRYKKSNAKTFFNRPNSGLTCRVCAQPHRTYQCPLLIQATPIERLKLIDEKALCRNCLYTHDIKECILIDIVK